MNIELFQNLRYRTSLLESLSWDESQLQALFDYLTHSFSEDTPVDPRVMIEVIRTNFGQLASDCFTSILKRQYITIFSLKRKISRISIRVYF